MSISIIIPVYNCEQYIGECLESVLKQSYREIEVICVDDASTDNSLGIIRKYANEDERVKVISFPENRSASVARKAGVEEATGKYIMFVDADDTIEPEACSLLYELMEREAVDILHFGAKIYNCDSLSDNNMEQMRNFAEPYVGELFGKEVFEGCFRDKKYKFLLWNKIYRAGLCKKAFRYINDERLPRGQDKYAYFIISYFATSYKGVDNMPLYHYHFGRGVTGHRLYSLEGFEKYCIMAKVAEAMRSFLEGQGTLEENRECYEKAKQGLLVTCVHCWNRELEQKDRADGFDLMIKYWGNIDIIGELARSNRDEVSQAEVTKALAGAKSIELKPGKVKTIAAMFMKIENGGTQRVLVQLLKLWVDMGYRCILFTEKEAAEDDYGYPESVERVVIGFGTAGQDSYTERLRRLQEGLRKYQVDTLVYHGWVSSSLLWDMLIAETENVRFIVHTHLTFSYMLRSHDMLFFKQPYRLRLSHALITLSESDTVFWSNFHSSVWEVANPFSFVSDKVQKTEHEGINILWLARVSPEKRPMDAIEVFRRVKEAVPESRLLFVGGMDEAWENRLAECVERAGIADSIEICGFQKDVGRYYSQADLFIMTSEYEGFPMTLIESKMYGLPCVMYQMPYLTLCRNGGGYVEVKPYDVAAMADAIVSLLSDRERLVAMGKEAYDSLDWLREYDYEGKWRSIFASLEQPWQQKDWTDKQSHMWEILLEGYYYKAVGAARERKEANEKSEMFCKEYERVSHSYSYRIGLMMTYLPRKIVKWIKT